MSYTKYKTLAIVIGGNNIGEASRSLNIFTRDFGLLRVRAQGVRELKSKLKYNLQNFFLLEAYLVRGRYGWMITEAYKEKNLLDLEDRNKAKILTKILLLVKKMLPNEDEHAEVFDIIHGGFNFLERERLSEKEAEDLEVLIVLKFLRALGYIKEKKKTEKFIIISALDRNLLREVERVRASIIKEINLSIKASGL